MRLTQSGFSGMRMSRWAGAVKQEYAYVAYNMVPEHPSRSSAMVTRPGLLLVGTALGTSHTWQYLGGWEKLDGTRYTVGIIDGTVYTYNWATSSWTAVLTPGTLSGAGISLSSTARVYCTTFAGTLVVSDGVNVPWTWDGTSSGGITRLSNAPIAYGQPAVYYAKLFFIQAADRGTISWSEENAANTGYEASGYNNVWTLSQTASLPLVTLLGTNDGLYFFRTGSIGVVKGAVNTDFRTTGTQDEVSTQIGTLSPGSVVLHDRTIHFADQYGRPHSMSGGTFTPLWLDMERCFGVASSADTQPYGIPGETSLGNLSAAQLAAITVCPLPSLGLVFFFYTGIGYGFSTQGRGLQTVWESYQGSFTGYGYDDFRRTPVILMGDSAGYSYSWGLQSNYQDWSRDSNAYVAMTQVLAGQPLAHTDDVEFRFPRTDLAYVPYNASTFVAVHLTSHAPVYGSAPTLGWSATASGSEQHKALGLAASGRWILPVITCGFGTADRVAIQGWTIEAYPRSRRPLAA